MQRSDCGEPSPSEYIYIIAPESMTQETSWNRVWTDYKSQKTRKSAVKICSQKWLQDLNNGNIHRQTNAKGEKSHGVTPLDKELQATDVCWGREM